MRPFWREATSPEMKLSGCEIDCWHEFMTGNPPLVSSPDSSSQPGARAPVVHRTSCAVRDCPESNIRQLFSCARTCAFSIIVTLAAFRRSHSACLNDGELDESISDRSTIAKGVDVGRRQAFILCRTASASSTPPRPPPMIATPSERLPESCCHASTKCDIGFTARLPFFSERLTGADTIPTSIDAWVKE